MSKMYDAGEKMGEGIESPMKESKDRKYYPHLDFDSKQFPEISKMDVGKKYMLSIEVKVTRKSQNEADGKEPKASLCCEVMRVGMDDDQESGMDKEEKMDKMVDKMYPSKKSEGEK